MKIVSKRELLSIIAGVSILAGAPTIASAYTVIDTYSYGPGQRVVARIKCNDGTKFNVKYYPDNGSSSRYYIDAMSGSSVADVSSKACLSHGG